MCPRVYPQKLRASRDAERDGAGRSRANVPLAAAHLLEQGRPSEVRARAPLLAPGTAARHSLHCSLCRCQARGVCGQGQGAAWRRGADLLVDGRDVAGALRPHQGGKPGGARPEQPAFVCDCLPRPARAKPLGSLLARTRGWRLVLTTAARPPADKRGTMTLKEVGITHALRRGVDDEKTLAMLHRGPVGVTHLGSALARALCLLTARRPVDQGSSGRLITPRGETGRPVTQPPPRLLELAACKAVDATGSDHAGTFRRGTSWTARS